MNKPNNTSGIENGISVLMTCYNAAAFLEKSIQSILKQTYSNFEFIIVDDGSIDDSETVVRSFSDERIRYIKSDHLGRAHALNYGLVQSAKDWVAVIDADDCAHPFRLEKQIRFLKDNPQIDIVSSWYAIHDGRKILYPIKSLTTHEDIKKRFILSSDIVHSGVMYRKEKIVNAGGYRETTFEDYDLWLRLRETAVFANIPEILLYVLVRSNSRSRQDLINRYRDHYEMMGNMYTEFGFHEFGVTTRAEENIYHGWREYFYGLKPEARKYWKLLGFEIVKQPRIWLAFWVTFLPDKLFTAFKEFRWKFRFFYLVQYFGSENRNLRKVFRMIYQ